LRKLTKSEILHSVEFSRAPVFIWDFPDGELKDKLTPIIKMRALIPFVQFHSRVTHYRIFNRDEKTVARFAYAEIWPYRNKRRSALAAHLSLRPVKGYPKYSRNLAKSFQEAGLTICTAKEFFLNALAAADKTPGSYSAKVNIQLDPAMRSDQAAKVVLRFLLNVMRINEAIFEKDPQIKNVFPTRTTDRFKKNFASVGKLSNVLRDLDVYLLNQDAYKAMLPAVLRDDIDPLFRHLRKKRAKAFQRVMRGLKSKKYAKIMKDWETFLNKPPPDSATASNAELPVIDLACQRIYKKYRGPQN
jgi:hypothetical protein